MKKVKNVPLTINHKIIMVYGHKMPIPWTINSVFYKGQLVTLEMKAQRHLDN
ncbi:MAG: YoaP domain-containing protein [Candidatus Thiodiazotropha sp. (ex Ustalcina ferruginea)]|nr:YoaP domain-containing protein [Candidatus Thiodiazotropha sp. (ex Ustalcina ferruginea)]